MMDAAKAFNFFSPFMMPPTSGAHSLPFHPAALASMNPMSWPLFAAAAAANQAQLAADMAKVNASLAPAASTPSQSTSTTVHPTTMKPTPFMIASLLEAASHHTQQQHNGGAHQISPNSERESQTSRGAHAMDSLNPLDVTIGERTGDFSDDDDDEGHTPGGGKKPRKARTIFTDKQLQSLEDAFDKQKYLSVQDRMELAQRMNLSDTQVKTWYQNRRTKWKRQTAVGMELLAEAGNFAAVQQLLRTNPYWATYMGSGGGGAPPPGMIRPPVASGIGMWPPPHPFLMAAAGMADLASAPLPSMGTHLPLGQTPTIGGRTVKSENDDVKSDKDVHRSTSNTPAGSPSESDKSPIDTSTPISLSRKRRAEDMSDDK